jgi:hypothetical protein
VIRHAHGRDYAMPSAHGQSTLGTPLTVFSSTQASEPVRFSAYGQTLQRHAATLVRQHNPIPYFHGFRGNISTALNVPGAIHSPVVFAQAYDGILPLALQPQVNKPQPYDVPKYAPGAINARTVVNDVGGASGI